MTTPKTTPKTAKPVDCNCIAKIDEGLKRENEELVTAFSWSTGKAYPTIRTQRIGGGRGKTRILLPLFCPFCGVPLHAGSKS